MLEYHLYMLPYSTARPTNFKDADDRNDFLDNEILTGPGYRQTIQASGQISNMKSHLMASVRASLARQTEADAKYAHNEQQEKADSHFAFERSVGSWNSLNGTDY
jgi:conjugal transfer/entry exclusion protein